MNKKLSTNSGSSGGAQAKQLPASTKGKPVPNQASNSATRAEVFFRGNILLWLDANIDPQAEDFQITLAQLQSVINTMHVFNNSDECTKFFSKVQNQNIFMVVSGGLSQEILPRIHTMSQLTAVFVYCADRSKYESLTKTYAKVRGVFTDIAVLCQSLKQATRQREEDDIDISFLPLSSTSDKNVNQLTQSFMYTKLIKEILLDLEHSDDSVKELVTYCCDKFADNQKELDNIKKFGTGYHLETPIYWYTCDTCIYKLVNWALRDHEFDTIIRMAFFIRDLLQHIEKLHREQKKNFLKEFTVYRGLNMSSEQFGELTAAQGGLVSFNNFLSTSTKPSIAMRFIDSNSISSVSCGVLFIITVDPANSSAPFACLDDVSYYKTEEKEILFSMQTIFRVGEIKQNDDGVWHVQLRLTSDNDQQLNTLIERMRMEIQGTNALYRLGALMIKVGEFDKAGEVFDALLRRTSDELERAHIHYQLGYINDNQGHYDRALHFYQIALPIYCNRLSPDHQNTASCYNNIGLVYDNKKDHANALLFYQKALEIYQKASVANDPNVATSYNSIGVVYNSRGEHSQALSYCKRALDIFEKSLPPTHQLLATSHNNLGLIYVNSKKYSEAIASHQRAVEIAQKTLLPNHPDLKVYKQNLETARKAGKK